MSSQTRLRIYNTVSAALLVVAAMLLPLVFNVFIFHEMQSTLLSVLSYLTSAALTLLILAVSCRIRTVGFIVLPILFLFAFLPWFVYSQYGVFISQDVVSSIIETNPREAAPYVTAGNIVMFVAPLLAIALGILAGHKFITKKTSNIIIAASLGLFAALALSCRPVAKKWHREHTPDNGNIPYMVRALSKGMYWPIHAVNLVKRLVNDHFEQASHTCHMIMGLPDGYTPPDGNETGETDMIVAMMLGESLRADHLQLNGYERETTPLLAARREQLVSFPRTCSFGLFTRISVIGVLTDAEIEGRTVYHKPFISILNKDGYVTSSTILQEEGIADEQMRLLLQDCHRHYSVDPRVVTEGHARIETVRTFAQAMEATADAPKAFYFIYDTGTHSPYERVHGNGKFFPDDVSNTPSDNPTDKLVNAYDNCILEVDWEVDSIIRMLEETHRPAVFVYVSDHGEALGENGIYTHGAAVPPVYTPAIFVWCSKEFADKYPDRFKALKSNAGKAISHDHIMHTVLSLSGYRRGAYKAELDLTNESAKETPVPADRDRLFELSCDSGD